MSELKLDLRDIRELPKEELDRLHRHVRARCDRPGTQTVAYALISIFTEIAGPAEVHEIIATSDSMGGIDMKLHLTSGPSSLDMEYAQSITESWQHVDIDRFERSASLPRGVYFTWDLNLAGTGVMRVNLTGISEQSARAIVALLATCFGTVEPRGERERRFVAELDARNRPATAPEQPHGAPERARRTPLESLVAVFDEDRDRYMEWHDGPSLYEVDQAIAGVPAELKAEASRIVAERIRKSYDPYLGRAAELLGTEECRAALDRALASAPHPGTASNAARNLLAMGRSAEAVEALRAIVTNAGLHWGDRIDALVNLKIALGAAGDRRPVSEFITPEMEAAIFEAVEDDDYLVRYHAADSLLKAAGEKKELSDHKELFAYICGKYPGNEKPGDEERVGFRKAAEIIRQRLRKSS